MNNTQNWNRLKKVVVILTIILILATLAGFIFSFFDKPILTYEEGYYPLPGGKSLSFIIVRNEGYKTANIVEICFNAKGDIENVMGQKGLIIGQIGEEELFREYVSFKVTDNSSCKIELPHLANGMKYTVCPIIKYGSGNPIDCVIVESANGGIANKYTHDGFLFLKYFIIGFIAGIFITLVVSYLYTKKKK